MGGMSKERIAFIGTGVMGKSMAGHLLDAGYPVSVYNRTKSKTDDLVARGAEWREAPADAAADADVVITIVGFPQDVEETYFGAQGIFQDQPQSHLHRASPEGEGGAHVEGGFVCLPSTQGGTRIACSSLLYWTRHG